MSADAAGRLDDRLRRQVIPGIEVRIQHRAERAADREPMAETVRVRAHVAMQAAEAQVVVAAARRFELRDVAGTDDRVLERDGFRKAQGDAVSRRAEALRARVGDLRGSAGGSRRARARPSCMSCSAIIEPKSGMPRTKERVPSIGSTVQR